MANGVTDEISGHYEDKFGGMYGEIDSAKNEAELVQAKDNLLKVLQGHYERDVPNLKGLIAKLKDENETIKDNARLISRNNADIGEYGTLLALLPNKYSWACDAVRTRANRHGNELRKQAEEERLEQERAKRQEAEEKRRQEQEDAGKKHDQPDNPNDKTAPDNSNPAPDPTPEPPTPQPAPQNDAPSFFPTPPPADANGNNPPARKPAKKPVANPFADLWQPINQSAVTNLTGLPPWTYPTNMPIWDPAPPHTAGAKRQPLAYAQLDKAARMEFSLLDIRMRTLGEHWDATTGAALLTAIKKFNLAHPDYPRGWQMQAQLALYLKRELEQKIAAKNLSELGVKNRD